ncbi:MAG: hypothetical protein AB7U82_04020 [Blastocatellales bacterium]
MNEQTKRDKLRSYFKKHSVKPGVWLMLLGIFGAMFSQQLEGAFAVSILMAVSGIIWLIIFAVLASNRIDDMQVDRWMQEDLNWIVGKSLNKTGLDRSEIIAEPLLITGPILWTTTGVSNEDLLWRKGKDGVARFTIQRVTVILLTKQLLASYACDFNFLKNVTLNERADEYHYKDVVSVSTQEISTSYTLPNGVSCVQAQAFRVSIVNGENIQVMTGASALAEITGGSLPSNGSEKAVQVIRKMLREKR